ncbi:MAG: hypothetical protein LBM25_04375 [Bacteroidales bacterium]|jgi:hypothetical protein|nr:hypothetical protein [Bacteroidales bacterium]
MITSLSLWWFLPLVVLAFLWSYWLYFRSKAKKNHKKKTLYILFSLRFLALSLIFFLILNPTIKNKKTSIEKPLIAILQDNSSSIIMTKDSLEYKTKYKEDLKTLIKELSKDYRVKLISFGSRVNLIENNDIDSINYNDYSTNLSSAFSFLERYKTSNLSSIILASDAIINQGEDVGNYVNNLIYPIYTIAMGDTTKRKDLSISDPLYNRIAYLNSKILIKGNVIAFLAKGNSTILKIENKGKVLHQERINIDEENFSKEFSFILDATEVGLKHYTISLYPLDNETTKENNHKDIVIRIIDARKKVAIIANNPSPDISAIKQIIENNENYEAFSFLFDDFKTSIDSFDIAILHNIPSNNNQTKLINEIFFKHTPALFFIGTKTNIDLFNKMQLSVEISQNTSLPNRAIPIINNDFSSFSIGENFQNTIKNMPPISSPSGKYRTTPLCNTLLFQEIGSIKTNYPLFAFTNKDNTPYSLFFGEGFFSWRLQNYLLDNNHNTIDEVISKSINFLGLKQDKNRFMVFSKEVFSEDEPVIFNAELYNESFEMVNSYDVSLSIKDEKGKTFNYMFIPSSNAYTLNISSLPSGKYSFEGKTKIKDETFSKKGTFFISSEKKEAILLVANSNLLYNMSEKTGGKMVYPNNILNLIKDIKQRKDIKPIIIERTINQPLTNSLWYFLIIILCLGAEWLINKLF